MRRFLILLLIFTIYGVSSAQVPYFSSAPGISNLYGYTSAKFRPGTNNIESYSTFQYGITDYFAAGTDIYTAGGESFWGFMLRAGYKTSKWFGIGCTVTPSFDLGENFKFSYLTSGIFMNGNILDNGSLFWCTNTWLTINRGSTYSINQFSYIGYSFSIKKHDHITPMVGLDHDWEFKKNPDIAAGAYYSHGVWNIYIWGNDFCKKYPRFVVGVDFKFSTK